MSNVIDSLDCALWVHDILTIVMTLILVDKGKDNSLYHILVVYFPELNRLSKVSKYYLMLCWEIRRHLYLFLFVVLQWKRNSSGRVVITHGVSNYFVNWMPFSLRRIPCWCLEALSSNSFLTHLSWRARWYITHQLKHKTAYPASFHRRWSRMIAKLFNISMSSNNPQGWAGECTIYVWLME